MELKTELEKLQKYIGKDSDSFDKQLAVIQKNFTSEKDKKAIDAFVRSGLNDLTEKLKSFNTDLSIKMQLAEASEILSMSYIAKNYFKKSTSWLFQRIHGLKVGGKETAFTDNEKQIFNSALKDIGSKIAAIHIS